MRSTYVKVFSDPVVLKEMLALRSNPESPWSYGALAKKYKVNKTSIRSQCIKAGLPDVVARVKLERRRKPSYYKEYLNQSLAVSRRKRWDEFVQRFGEPRTSTIR